MYKPDYNNMIMTTGREAIDGEDIEVIDCLFILKKLGIHPCHRWAHEVQRSA